MQNKVRRSRGRGGNKLWISHKRVLVEAGGLPAGETVCGVIKHKLGCGAEIVVVVVKHQAGRGDAGFDMNGASDVAGENVVLDGDMRRGCGGTGSVQIDRRGIVPANVANENVADAISDEALAVDVIPDEIVEKLVVLRGGVIREETVRAVVVKRVVLNGVVGRAGESRAGTGIVGKLHTVSTVGVNEVFLNHIVAGGLEFNTTALRGRVALVGVVVDGV